MQPSMMEGAETLTLAEHTSLHGTHDGRRHQDAFPTVHTFSPPHLLRYGTECSRKVAGEPMEAGDVESGMKPWLKSPGLGMLPPSAEVSKDIESNGRSR